MDLYDMILNGVVKKKKEYKRKKKEPIEKKIKSKY